MTTKVLIFRLYPPPTLMTIYIYKPKSRNKCVTCIKGKKRRQIQQIHWKYVLKFGNFRLGYTLRYEYFTFLSRSEACFSNSSSLSDVSSEESSSLSLPLSEATFLSEILSTSIFSSSSADIFQTTLYTHGSFVPFPPRSEKYTFTFTYAKRRAEMWKYSVTSQDPRAVRSVFPFLLSSRK